MKRAKKSKSSALWSDAATGEASSTLATNAASPSEQRREKMVGFQKFTIYALVVLAGAVVVMQAANLSTGDKTEVVAAVSSTDVNTAQGKAAATTTLQSWLESDPQPLPGGVILSWDGYEAVKAGKSKNNERPADRGEVHHFTLAVLPDDGNKTVLYYESSVLVSVDPTLGALVQGSPSLLPVTPSLSSGWSQQTWAGYEKAQVGEAVEDAVTSWADAFTGTPAALRIAVGDEDKNHAYIPLSGAKVNETVVQVAGVKESPDGEPDTNVLIARVQLKVQWGEAESSPALVTYDVLIHGANTAAPRVVAWGAAGTGPTLEKYGNAVVGLDVKELPKDSIPAPAETPDEEAE